MALDAAKALAVLTQLSGEVSTQRTSHAAASPHLAPGSTGRDFGAQQAALERLFALLHHQHQRRYDTLADATKKANSQVEAARETEAGNAAAFGGSQ
ncbi:hypothetical protein GCM10007338_10910 [Corynebacterium pelargi]|uniref:Uncharacterized protein n=2 Tax=Corynebacterium pelargi TaxID=1471400 RepID=A0A410WAT1_9CORY|nr:hypothetical protein CPELA_08970 [Corynebacterium pelargi]GGG75212.1 hypothetical protein GCM10007338_10910 [Corynebacterium pelargi]